MCTYSMDKKVIEKLLHTASVQGDLEILQCLPLIFKKVIHHLMFSKNIQCSLECSDFESHCIRPTVPYHVHHY